MDLVRMQQAADAFLGQHDFRNFCKVDAEHIKHCVRCILDFRIGEYPGLSIDGKRIAQVHIRGSAFLWHQVCVLHIPNMQGIIHLQAITLCICLSAHQDLQAFCPVRKPFPVLWHSRPRSLTWL